MNKNAREVERHFEIIISEGAVLLRIEHLEHRRGRVAAKVGAHLSSSSIIITGLLQPASRKARTIGPAGR